MLILNILQIFACFNISMGIFAFYFNKEAFIMLHISSLIDNIGIFILIPTIFLSYILYNTQHQQVSLNFILYIKVIILIIGLICSNAISTSLIALHHLTSSLK